MRIFFAGDHMSGTGPANVTKYYIENLPTGTLYQKRKSKLARVPEIIINTLRSDVIVYSGYSKQNLLGMNIAKKLKKPCAYLMHGCVEYENEINLEPDEEMCRVERQTMKMADTVIAVSKSFANWLKDYYPQYSDKIDYVTNGIDTALRDEMSEDDGSGRCAQLIYSIGGGMPRKKIRFICEAVELLRKQDNIDYRLVVAGARGADTDEINSYSFVDNKGKISFKESVALMKKAAVFVQNSSFETFGLAPVEAVACSCSTLCSKNVGALDIIDGLRDEDIIDRYDDPQEIAEKIRNLIKNPNGDYLKNNINWETSSWKIRSRELADKLEKLVK